MADSRRWFWKASAGGVSFALDGRVLVDSVENRGCAEDVCLITQRMFDSEGSDMEVATERTKRALFYQDDEREFIPSESLFCCFALFDKSE